MLEPIKHLLSSQRIVLASASPRRREILQNVGLKFEIVPSTFEETLDKSSFQYPYEYVKETALRKTLEVAQRLSADQHPPDLVIGSDTVVSMDNVIYEKPKNKDHAFQMLSGLSGRTHTVYTGVVLVSPKLPKGSSHDFKVHSFHAATDVKFSELSSEVIQCYIDTGEPMDKAGGYGIQAIGGTLVEGIQGDYFNVMGFPLNMFCSELRKLFSQGFLNATDNDKIS